MSTLLVYQQLLIMKRSIGSTPSIECYLPSGPDSISPLVLKYIAKSIVKPLTKIYNYSLTIGQLPEKLPNYSYF